MDGLAFPAGEYKGEWGEGMRQSGLKPLKEDKSFKFSCLGLTLGLSAHLPIDC